MSEALHDTHPTVSRLETCSLSVVRRVAAMLDQDPEAFAEGGVLPRGWQFILLGADTPRSKLRKDGFPGLGVALPDFGLPRLVLGGRTVTYHCDIQIGEKIHRESRIDSVSRKDGKAGPMAIVSILHEFKAEGSASGPVLTETQNYVLLGAAKGGRAAPAGDETRIQNAKVVTPDETLLFQYSALGFNSHRIHIDRGYAQDEEGFPDLVVNGGLLTLLMTEYFREKVGKPISTLASKHIQPLYCNRPIEMTLDDGENGWVVRAYDEEVRLAAEVAITAE